MLKRIGLFLISLLISVVLHYLVIYRLLTVVFLEKYLILFIGILAYIFYFLTLVIVKKVKKIEINISFGLYLIVVFIAIFLKEYSISDVILNPVSFLNREEVTLTQTVLNISLLIPLGVYQKYYKISTFILLISFVLMECFQYLLNVGTFDLGDVTLYIVGLLIGKLAYKFYKEKM